MPPLIDIVGQTFGRLTVIKRDGTRDGRAWWLCKCECGNSHGSASYELLKGRITSCGCVRKNRGSQHVQWKGCGDISGSVWNNIVKSHTRRVNKNWKIGKEFDLTIDYVWELFLRQDGKCSLSGIKLDFGKRRTASLDRINSKLGYIEGNVQWVHKDINLMKNVLSQDRFIELCRMVCHEKESCKETIGQKVNQKMVDHTQFQDEASKGKSKIAETETTH